MAKVRKLKHFNYQGLVRDKAKLLDQFLTGFFPDETIIQALIQRQKQKKESQQLDTYRLDDLPFHLHQPTWLTRYILKYCEKYGIPVSEAVVAKYVTTSKNFKNACMEFGDKYMQLKLMQMLTTARASHETVVEAGFPDMSHRMDCDHFFYQHALTYFILKGFDRQRVEINLEKNAQLWRPLVMRQAFENICNLDIMMFSMPQTDNGKMEYSRKKHRYGKLWLQNREQEHQQRHHKVKISRAEAEKLREQIQLARNEMLEVLMHEEELLANQTHEKK